MKSGQKVLQAADNANMTCELVSGSEESSMGVDIQTYRCRIGSFKFAVGVDVITIQIYINFSGSFRTIGCVIFIGLLLLIAGVESNPGPREDPDVPTTKILVTALPEKANKESIELFFNAMVQGFGKVIEVKVRPFHGSAVINFDNEDAAGNVLKRPHITIFDTDITAEAYHVKAIEVHDFDIDTTSEEDFKEYFERREISDGDMVEKIILIKERGVARILFNKGYGATVVMREPFCILKNKRLTITTYEGIFEDVLDHASTDFEADNDCSSATNTDATHQRQMEMSAEFDRVIELLELKNHCQNKLTVTDVIAFNPDENMDKPEPLKELPLCLLKGIVFVNSDSRDSILSRIKPSQNISESGLAGNINDLFDDDDDDDNGDDDDCDNDEHYGKQSLNPADIFIVVLQCCDPILKQLLYKKLYLCKKALPFISIPFAMKQCKPQLCIWPLRSLQVECMLSLNDELPKETEIGVLNLPTKIITFARFGRPHFSKSNLLNVLLSDRGANTFFSKECKHGSADRKLTQGLVEIFWLPKVGKKKDKFDDTLTFLNCRGDFEKYPYESTLKFVSEISDVIVLVVDIGSIQNKATELQNILAAFSHITLIIANPLKKHDQTTVTEFNNNANVNTLLKTFKGNNEVSIVDMASSLQKTLNFQIKDIQKKTLEDRILNLNTFSEIQSDEDDDLCSKGKTLATEMMVQMIKHNDSHLRRKVITPIQTTIAPDLGKHTKLLHRAQVDDKSECLKGQIRDLQYKLLGDVTEPVKYFVNCLVKVNDSSLRQIFISWLKIFIYNKKGIACQSLIQETVSHKRKLERMRNDDTVSKEKIQATEKRIKQIDDEIEDLSFNVEHLFREIGYIYDTIILFDKTANGLPSSRDVALAISDLILTGNSLEIIDGNSFLLPVKWMEKVFHSVSDRLGKNNVLAISVLGLQSSGKSTLLNTMFGTQFAASAGRCTKGIHIQLIPVKTQQTMHSNSLFNFVLLIHTEGLRAPEFCDKTLDHDNALATVITGLGDITILNIKGENTSEINDILHVIVHAFLRLKVVNQNIDIRKRCYFVHQNVSSILASEKRRHGLEKLHKVLDKATEDAAQIECIRHISSFDEIMEFNINRHVWHMPNLWQGNPPMEFVNTDYSTSVLESKCSIVQNAFRIEHKSYKSLQDTIVHAIDLWKGVLSEDFVFAFRNSLEIKANINLTEELSRLYRRVEITLTEEHITLSNKKLSACETKSSLEIVLNELKSNVGKAVNDEAKSLKNDIQKYIDSDENREITEKWRDPTLLRIDFLCEELLCDIKEEISSLCNKRKLYMMTINKKLEEELYEKSMKVAKELKSMALNDKAIESKFEECWASVFANETMKHTEVNIEKCFHLNMLRLMPRDIQLLQSQLKSYNEQPFTKESFKRLSGTFENIGASEEDFSCPQKSIPFFHKEKVNLETTNDNVEEVLSFFDTVIARFRNAHVEITKLQVNIFFKEVKSDIDKYQEKYKWSKTFTIRLLVHISACAKNCFKEHNAKYLRDTESRLTQYKAKEMKIFKAHIDDRNTEEKAAIEFTAVIKTKVIQIVSATLPTRVKSSLSSVIPMVKYHLILEILTELVREHDFQLFRKYIDDPKDFAEKWIKDRANNYLFDREKNTYYGIACFLLNTCFESVKHSVMVSVKECTRTSSTSIETWIQTFVKNEQECATTPQCFHLMKNMLLHKVDLKCLQDYIFEKLEESKAEIELSVSKVNRNSVQWESILSPIEVVTKSVWGCDAKCPFCGEPCALDKKHKGSKHYALQHKPKGIRGIYNPVGKEASVTSCNVDVQSRNKFYRCKLIDYKCRGGKGECQKKEHRFYDYRELFPNWDIKPMTNMEDGSKFWMWCMTEFREDITKTYKIKVKDIPLSWYNISQNEALDSLRNIYN